MNTDEPEAKRLHREFVSTIMGCASEVLTALGHGVSEKPCENARAVKSGLRNIAFDQQARCEVTDQGGGVGKTSPTSLPNCAAG